MICVVSGNTELIYSLCIPGDLIWMVDASAADLEEPRGIICCEPLWESSRIL